MVDATSDLNIGTSTPQAPTRLGPDWLSILRDSQHVLDVVFVGLAGVLALFCFPTPIGSPNQATYWWIVVAGSLLAPFFLRDAYAIDGALPTMDGWRRSKRALTGTVILFGMLLAGLYATDSSEILPRPLVTSWFVWTLVLLLAQRLAMTLYLGRLERLGVLRETVAIVGAGPLADRLIDHLTRTQQTPITILGIFDDRELRSNEIDFRPSGSLSDLLALGQGQRIDRVIMTLPWSADERILELVRRLKAMAVDILLCPDRVGFNLPRRTLDGIGGLPLLCVATKPIARWNSLLKRAEDLVIGSLMLLLLSPVMLAVALAIRLESPGPVVFRQRRHGFNNSEFEVLKFRSMRYAERDITGAQQTSRTDSRVTRVGRFIRRYSLDEIPQLINVLRGEMSVVGPRPHPIGMLTATQLCHEIVEDYAHRHRVKPGITGWAQVNGCRGATETPEELQVRVSYDLQYIENWTLLFDLKIIMMTMSKIISTENAF